MKKLPFLIEISTVHFKIYCITKFLKVLLIKGQSFQYNVDFEMKSSFIIV